MQVRYSVQHLASGKVRCTSCTCVGGGVGEASGLLCRGLAGFAALGRCEPGRSAVDEAGCWAAAGCAGVEGACSCVVVSNLAQSNRCVQQVQRTLLMPCSLSTTGSC